MALLSFSLSLYLSNVTECTQNVQIGLLSCKLTVLSRFESLQPMALCVLQRWALLLLKIVGLKQVDTVRTF